jgi:hypothetical protein
MLEIISDTRMVRWTWSQQHQEGRYLQSKTDYVIAQDVSDFRHLGY